MRMYIFHQMRTYISRYADLIILPNTDIVFTIYGFTLLPNADVHFFPNADVQFTICGFDNYTKCGRCFYHIRTYDSPKCGSKFSQIRMLKLSYTDLVPRQIRMSFMSVRTYSMSARFIVKVRIWEGPHLGTTVVMSLITELILKYYNSL